MEIVPPNNGAYRPILGYRMFQISGAILLLGSLVFLGGCDNITLLNSKGQVGVSEKWLIMVSLCAMLIVVIPVIIMAIIFAYKYRASNTKSTYKPHWDFSYKIEAIVWGIPCLIIIVLGIICWKSTHELEPSVPIKSASKPIEINVVALDWKWLFIYPNEHIATVNQVAFPVNVPVKFEITSDSVMNSFFIPQLGSQIYAMAGMNARLYLIADQIGVYDGISANFSGAGFSGMKFKALALSKDDWGKWVNKVKLSSNVLGAEAYEKLAKPSEYHPVEYYSKVDAGLFQNIINKYMKMEKKEHSHEIN
jgi:cytochrome o ubiquinol oxidase subunit II